MKLIPILCIFTAANLFADDSNLLISSFYDQESDFYDSGYSTALCLAENEIIMNSIKPLLSENVLDIGCGTGILLDYLSPQKYLGIDISPGMIAKAQSKHPEREFIVDEMESATFKMESESFDTVVALFGPFSYSLHPDRLLNEFYRVLKQGGVLILMPYTKRIENNLFLGEFATSSEQSIPKIYYTTNTIESLMKNSNFEQVTIKGINFFGSFIETLDSSFQKNRSPEFFSQFLRKEQELAQLLPIEYARHCIVIAKK
jgi:ubiquinone/menaquinone biosynthesis C-methylase UbiE